MVLDISPTNECILLNVVSYGTARFYNHIQIILIIIAFTSRWPFNFNTFEPDVKMINKAPPKECKKNFGNYPFIIHCIFLTLKTDMSAHRIVHIRTIQTHSVFLT